MSSPLVRRSSHAGRVEILELASGAGNILDRGLMEALETAAIELRVRRPHVVVLRAAGEQFSFGSSIQEHLATEIGPALERFDRLLRALVRIPAPTLAVVRGVCLGGGLELVLGCDLLLVEEGVSLGCPEIQLGVFPPIAAALLPGRIGAARAAELILTGRRLAADEAVSWGLAQRIAAPGESTSALEAWLEADFLPRSAAALRHAAVAARGPVRAAIERVLPAQIQLYLDRLQGEADAAEGIEAFLAKRPPRWEPPGGA